MTAFETIGGLVASLLTGGVGSALVGYMRDRRAARAQETQALAERDVALEREDTLRQRLALTVHNRDASLAERVLEHERTDKLRVLGEHKECLQKVEALGDEVADLREALGRCESQHEAQTRRSDALEVRLAMIERRTTPPPTNRSETR